MKYLFCVSLFVLTLSASITSDANNHYEQGLKLYRTGNYSLCIKYLKTHLDESNDPRAFYLIGYAYYKLKDHTSALQYFNQAYLADPGFSPQNIKWKQR